jgi:hypothetical protein
MSQQYDSSLLKTLIQLAAHKCHLATDAKGLGLLADEIEKCREKQGIELTARYLRNLYADITKALENEGQPVSRDSEFIYILLNFLDFPDWKSFERAAKRFQVFFPEPETIATDHRADCLVLFSMDLSSSLSPLLTLVGKQLDMNLTLQDEKGLSSDDLVKLIPECLKDHQSVFWVMNTSFSEVTSNNEWADFLVSLVEEGRVIPVWLGEESNAKTLQKLGLKQEQVAKGKTGLLLGLYYLHALLNSTAESPDRKASPAAKAKTHIGHLENNSGTVITGDITIKSDQTSLGNFTQNINNDQRKQSD